MSMKLKQILLKNRVVLRDSYRLIPAVKNRVNINAWVNPGNSVQNIGDALSEIIVEKTAQLKGIDINKKLKKTKHLYAVGSVLMRYQNQVIWGSGFGYDYSSDKRFPLYSAIHRFFHKTDIRAVRGPEMRRIIRKMGIKCPEVYGDPAVLLPCFYKPKPTDKIDYIIIPHYYKYNDFKKYDNVLSTYVNDFRPFIDKMCSAKFVISSSLHGIILAESYGIPAVMIRNTPSVDITKYKDWYYSTGRYDFKIVDSVEEALSSEPPLPPMGVIKEMQRTLINAFPCDMWED